MRGKNESKRRHVKIPRETKSRKKPKKESKQSKPVNKRPIKLSKRAPGINREAKTRIPSEPKPIKIRPRLTAKNKTLKLTTQQGKPFKAKKTLWRFKKAISVTKQNKRINKDKAFRDLLVNKIWKSKSFKKRGKNGKIQIRLSLGSNVKGSRLKTGVSRLRGKIKNKIAPR